MKFTLIFFSFTLLLIMNNKLNGQKIFPYEYEVFTLDNGLKTILIPMENPGLVAYYTVIRTGSRDEWEPGLSGFAHFFEHMMFRGTKRFPGNVYDSITTAIGAKTNAYTSDDLTVYHLNFASEDLETVIDIESDRFRNLDYSKEQFQTESGAVYGEYRKGRTNPWFVAYEAMRNLAFEKHTYKHTTIGFEEDIKMMPEQYEFSLSFYNRYYRPENCILVIAGDIDVDKTKNMIKKYYSDWQMGYVPPKITEEEKQNGERSIEVSYEGKTLPLLMISFKSDAFGVDNLPMHALSSFASLAFGETSDIYKKLVLDEQKVQYLSASNDLRRDPYLFTVSAMIKKESDIEYVKNEILAAVDKYKNELISNEKLNNLKKRNKYSFIMRLDSPEAVASSLPWFITLTGGIEDIDKYYFNMEKVTPDDIKNAVNKFLIKDNMNLVVLKGAL